MLAQHHLPGVSNGDHTSALLTIARFWQACIACIFLVIGAWVQKGATPSPVVPPHYHHSTHPGLQMGGLSKWEGSQHSQPPTPNSDHDESLLPTLGKCHFS